MTAELFLDEQDACLAASMNELLSKSFAEDDIFVIVLRNLGVAEG